MTSLWSGKGRFARTLAILEIILFSSLGVLILDAKPAEAQSQWSGIVELRVSVSVQGMTISITGDGRFSFTISESGVIRGQGSTQGTVAISGLCRGSINWSENYALSGRADTSRRTATITFTTTGSTTPSSMRCTTPGGQSLSIPIPSQSGSGQGDYTIRLERGASVVEQARPPAQGYAKIMITSGSIAEPDFDFSIGVSPSTRTAFQGQEVRYTITVSGTGRPQSVVISVFGDDEVRYTSTANWEPKQGVPNPSFTSVLQLQTSAKTPPGTWTITIRGQAGSIVRERQIQLVVGEVRFDYEVLASPSRRVISPGECASYTIDVRLRQGEPGPVTLSSTAARGITTEFIPSSVGTPSFSRILQICALPDAPTGVEYHPQITGESERFRFTRSTTVTVEIPRPAAQPPQVPQQPPQLSPPSSKEIQGDVPSVSGDVCLFKASEAQVGRGEVGRPGPVFAGKCNKITPGMDITLQPGDVIKTTQNGRITVRYEDGSVVTLGPLTSMSLKEGSPTERFTRGQWIKLDEGNLWVNVAKADPARPIRTRLPPIATPRVGIFVRGTQFTVDVGTDGETKITTLEGSVEVQDLESKNVVSLGANRVLVVPAKSGGLEELEMQQSAKDVDPNLIDRWWEPKERSDLTGIFEPAFPLPFRISFEQFVMIGIALSAITVLKARPRNLAMLAIILISGAAFISTFAGASYSLGDFIPATALFGFLLLIASAIKMSINRARSKQSTQSQVEAVGHEVARTNTFCVNCGNRLGPNSKYCDKCGTPTQMEAGGRSVIVSQQVIKRPTGVSILAVLTILEAILLLFLGPFIIYTASSISPLFDSADAMLVAQGGLYTILAFVNLPLGWGLLKGRSWARKGTIAITAVSFLVSLVLSIPNASPETLMVVVAGLAWLIIVSVYLTRPRVKSYFRAQST